jgi:UDP-3-O-[3-hydroxymyristoyl] glucosamine N-acyltransferase
VLRSYVELRDSTYIGSDCYIDSHVVTSGECQISHHVTLRYGVIIARGCRIGAHSFLAPYVMTENLSHLRLAIGGAQIGEHVFIGTRATLAAGISICDNVVIGAHSYVNLPITEPGVYFGTPARYHGPLPPGFFDASSE